ncbi:MAG: nickel pincer cofactor biosynthesis protein LarB [Desulfovibrio sp.]|nr:nickel pincer cofactor biosynthesis protein LarB [Desulfovibrio sp.]MCA1986036.1 nickel pincer cofactor biosynthesis protein LarB [Desulfovibrio sp.]
MDQQRALQLLQAVAAGERTPRSVLDELRLGPFKDALLAAEGLHLDAHRALRTGHGEVVFAPGKPIARLLAAMKRLQEAGPALATRVDPEQAEALCQAFPDGEWWADARLFACNSPQSLRIGADDKEMATDAALVVVTAGASDLPVALEAVGTARFLGLTPALVADAGVAGLHRLTPHLSLLGNARLLIVVAGMEGALPSVLAGLTGRPILAVPTSVGYGASFGGLAALLAMLNCCAPGVAVLNIDNGFGAATMAAKLLG